MGKNEPAVLAQKFLRQRDEAEGGRQFSGTVGMAVASPCFYWSVKSETSTRFLRGFGKATSEEDDFGQGPQKMFFSRRFFFYLNIFVMVFPKST